MSYIDQRYRHLLRTSCTIFYAMYPKDIRDIIPFITTIYKAILDAVSKCR